MQWQGRTKVLKEKLRTVPGDALLTAATVVYLAVFNEETRDCLTNQWTKLFRDRFDAMSGAMNIPIDDRYSIIDLLSTDSEQMEWKRKGLPCDSFMLTNALITRTSSIGGNKCWPLFIDPLNQAPFMVRCIEEGMVPKMHEDGSTG